VVFVHWIVTSVFRWLWERTPTKTSWSKPWSWA